MRFLTLLCAAAFFCASLARAGDRLPSPITYIAEPAYRELGLSPSGRYLVAAREIPAESGKDAQIAEERVEDLKKGSRRSSMTLDLAPSTLRGDQVLIFDLGAEDAPHALNFAGRSVHKVEWASEDRLLVTLSVRYDMRVYGVRVILPGSRIISIDWRSGETAELFSDDQSILQTNLHLSQITDLLRGDPDHILMPARRNGDLDLWKVNIKTGDATRVEPGQRGTFYWVTDKSGRAVFRLDANDRLTVMRVYAKTAEGKWSKVAVARLDDKGEAGDFWPIAAGEKPGEMYVLAFPKDEPRATIKLYDLNTGQFKQTVLSQPAVDIGGGLQDRATGEYIGGWYVDDRYHLALKDPELQRHIDAVNKYFANSANVYLIDASPAGGKMLLYVSAPEIPGEYYVYYTAEHRLDALFHTLPDIDSTLLAPTEIWRYQARDGKLITAYVTHPPGKENLPAPLIVLPHGGPQARDMFDFDPLAQFLAGRGYRILQPNFRGSSGYGREFSEAGYGEWGGKMQDDVTDGVRGLIERGLASEKNACIVGASYGGYAALYGAMTTPDLYACAVSISGVADLPDILDYERKIEGASSEAYEFAVKSIGHPDRDRDRLIARSPARHAEKISVPLLIIHGRADLIAPYDQAEKLMAALDKAGKPYEKLIFPDEGHGFARASSNVQYMRAVEGFLFEHLPPQ